MRRERGSIAPAFNAGMVIGVVLYLVLLWPLVAKTAGALFWILAAAGGLAFWVLGVNLMLQTTGPGLVASLVLLGAGTAAGWVWRAPAWLGPVLVITAAILSSAALILLAMREDAAAERRSS